MMRSDLQEPGAAPTTALPIVNYRSIVGDAPEPPRDLLPEEILGERATAEVEGEPLGAILPRIELLLRQETVHPDVLVAPRDKWTARFQSIVARTALETPYAVT